MLIEYQYCIIIIIIFQHTASRVTIWSAGSVFSVKSAIIETTRTADSLHVQPAPLRTSLRQPAQPALLLAQSVGIVT